MDIPYKPLNLLGTRKPRISKFQGIQVSKYKQKLLSDAQTMKGSHTNYYGPDRSFQGPQFEVL